MNKKILWPQTTLEKNRPVKTEDISPSLARPTKSFKRFDKHEMQLFVREVFHLYVSRTEYCFNLEVDLGKPGYLKQSSAIIRQRLVCVCNLKLFSATTLVHFKSLSSNADNETEKGHSLWVVRLKKTWRCLKEVRTKEKNGWHLILPVGNSPTAAMRQKAGPTE